MVAVAGAGAERVVAGLGGLHNVRAVVAGERGAAGVTEQVAHSSATYVVHDGDPLAAVGDAWVEYFDQAAAPGGLEVAIEAALAELRSQRAVLPDYYVVLDPEEMPETRRHWWLGVLAGAAPARVVPAHATAAAVRDVLSHLTAGRWWPDDLDGWLRALPTVVPDQVGVRP
nr:hypothetical protein GCM10010200_029570 [Actinomadura rugatobispora]